MELWIRSQDRLRLVKATDIRIYYAKEENIWVIEDCDDLGYYQTKERVLEVLDDIQNFMTIEIHEDNINYEQGDLILKGKIVDSLCKIYQMPKE